MGSRVKPGMPIARGLTNRKARTRLRGRLRPALPARAVAAARDPEANLKAGARYLRDLPAQFNNDLPVALAACNAGPGAVQKHGNAIPPYAETRRYVPRVLDLYQRGGRVIQQ